MDPFARQFNNLGEVVIDNSKVPFVCLYKPAKTVTIRRSCSCRILSYPHPHQQPRQVHIYFLLRQGGSLLIITRNTTREHSLLPLNKDSHSHARGFLTGTAPVLLT